MAEHETSPDSDNQLKKRARRRLVGASALALLAVIVLPMVMDHEPRPPVQDIQVRIPNQDTTGIAAKIPGKPVATPLPPVEQKTEAKVESKPDAKPEAKPEPKTEAKAPVALPASAAPVVALPTPVAAPAATTPAAKPPVVEKKTERPAAEASGQWVVQLGAYKDAANVKLLLAKLKGMGVPAYTEHFDSPQGPRTRVRAGPFPSREAAEKARVGKIKKVGVDGPVAPK